MQGVPHLVYVEGASPCKNRSTGEDGWPAVSAAVGNAALVVAEMMPTPPYCDWLKVRLFVVRRSADNWSGPMHGQPASRPAIEALCSREKGVAHRFSTRGRNMGRLSDKL